VIRGVNKYRRVVSLLIIRAVEVGVGRIVCCVNVQIGATGFCVNIAGRREKTDIHGFSLSLPGCFEKLI